MTHWTHLHKSIVFYLNDSIALLATYVNIYIQQILGMIFVQYRQLNDISPYFDKMCGFIVRKITIDHFIKV